MPLCLVLNPSATEELKNGFLRRLSCSRVCRGQFGWMAARVDAHLKTMGFVWN
jgi:hypothetical protein